MVVVKGTNAVQNLGNGITVWNEDWKEWLDGSKTGSFMTVAAPVETPEPTETATTPSDPGSQDGQADTSTQTSQASFSR